MSRTDEPTESDDQQQSSSAETDHPLEWDESPNNRKTAGERQAVSKREEKTDARKIVTGESKYTADYARNFPTLAEAAVLRSDIAHGYATEIDTSAAEGMDGVYAVITPDSEEVPDTTYTSAGQSYPEPSPWDLTVLRRKVRFVGDPIAAVAATDASTADKAIRAIDVTYEKLDAVFDTEAAMEPDAPQIHDADRVENSQPGADYERNIEAHTDGEIGDVDGAFEEAATRDDWIVTETEWETPYQSHCVPEPHTTIAHRDEDNRFHLITSTQVPYHTRRQLAHLFDVPIRDIRVSKPRIGAGFGSKQSMLIEPITMALMLAADRPVKLEATRREEFYAMRSRRPARVRLRSVVTKEGDIEALDMSAITNSGAYGPHGLTVTGSIATKPLPLYTHTPNIRFEMKAVHTNLPIGGAIRGYGAPQGHFALEGHMDEVADELGIDSLELRSRNLIGHGDLDTASGVTTNGEHVRRIRSCGIDDCIAAGKAAIGWDDIEQPDEDHLHRACGVALTAQKSGVAGDELGAAHIKMNEDGSFILQTGAVDIGPGADTAMAQIAAEVLGVEPADVLVQPSDTDVSPFDYGAYASSTTYVTGSAVKEAAEDARTQLFEFASRMLAEPAEVLEARDGAVYSEQTGESVLIEEIGYESIYGDELRAQVMGQASFSTDESPPPFGAQFADVTVNEETGEFEVHKLVFAVDCGVAINPDLAEGQVDGAMHMSYELATSAGLSFDEDGRPETLGFREYGMPTTADQPPLESILVETHEPTGPFGAKSVAEIPVNGVPPALSNAIRRAVGVRVNELPITAEKIRAQLDES
ncbi:xanthine dehydrogenase family protein molybdopterin-binding subunit [Halalkalicoccus jeotgali]|uniref:Aldehyde oxidase and xanthine dehydrogenase molybdopterin binding protein n=1 Tax=Halalkalicoccus jeotgali (strain DSM 18796 / CECT 7217 / JCM 14584 / KCTC 4019 / B3) TaxID=795797 RepID=D8JBC5_HALJB|nr:molybdopterin cofactor-binding domain-containing protein [Halalkalicoccus jeotgali]ADJ16578.1 aldehyde oxidase and xanthine dehydrogenase molybdopterin binding protein [Halalkalicoccus jeotgali B3]ELY41326.1 aldehyde oxidase and xanthine dehydrogenase molybdopterin binding protein [Halalkalicoccus jeotgali B3]